MLALEASIREQFLAPLPVFHASPSSHVFEPFGLDYFGLLLIKQGRNTLKRYACVFNCMASRALHIKIAYSLDTSSFLNAFRRFACRRVFPSHVYRDNGGIFIGAEREMREGVLMLRELHDTLLPLGVNWHFNPPAASHQGGIWERMIRTVLKVLRMLINDRILTEEQLSTFMV